MTHRRLLIFAFAAGVILGGCTPATQRKLIISANEAQDAAAQSYDLAKAQEADATRACVKALKAARLDLPAHPDEIKPKCAAVGSPVPYDPVKLQQAAGPINSLYDGIRVANAERKLSGDNLAPATLANLASLFEKVVADLTEAGIAVPEKVKLIGAALRGGP